MTIAPSSTTGPSGLIPTIKARPFNISFNRQMSTMRGLYGQQLRITKFTRSEIEAMLSPLLEYYPKYLRGIICDRVMCCILTRQKSVG